MIADVVSDRASFHSAETLAEGLTWFALPGTLLHTGWIAVSNPATNLAPSSPALALVLATVFFFFAEVCAAQTAHDMAAQAIHLICSSIVVGPCVP
jgi:hypothetical protein